jgi:uncharacterized iron-regulated membrane protein
MEDWKTRVLVITGAAGLLAGVLGGVMYIRAVEDAGVEKPQRPDTGAMITLGLAALGLVRQIAALGTPPEEKK